MGRHVSRIHRARRVRRLRRIRRGMALGLVGASLLAGLTAPAWADSVSCGAMTVPVLQRVNPETSLSIDTTWKQEADNAAQRYGYTVDPGVVYKAAWDSRRGLVGIHRLYKPGGADFRMLPAGPELDAVVASGYRDQGTWFYASAGRRLGCVAVHTFVNGIRHRTAATAEGKAALVAQGWKDLGPSYWAAAPDPVTPPTSTSTLPTATPSTPTSSTSTTSSSSSTSTTTVPTTTITDPTTTTTLTPTTQPTTTTTSTTTTTTVPPTTTTQPTTTTTSTTTTQPTTTTTTTTPPTTTTTTTPPLPPDPTPDGSFGLAWLPDTQDETSAGPYYDRFEQRTRWLAENKDDLDLKFVGSSGDVTNWGWLVPSQFQVASTAMQTIQDAGLPYAMAIGNHDTRAVGWNGVQGSTGYGGSAYMYNPECKTRFPASECRSDYLVRHTEEFNGTFTAGRYGSVGGAYEPGKVDNIFSTFSAGGHRWLVLTLELWARPDVVSWARTVVEEHPQHNVIIQTHAYLSGDGSIMGDNGGYGSTSPKYLWDNLVSQYPNIKMVFSGHVGVQATRTDVGVHGNTVYSFLQCFHDKTSNPVRLLDIDPAAGTISTRIYAPWTKTSYPDYAKTFSGVKFVG
ncbi:Calcineurin-like phosphoesterase [Pedococcus dokdonensis]|uniref:Calcineurin-like phosphoesterase n=1 Tax=Pedococcus dokdonensis TaxID=443156 RepID=A0A1H0T9H6_9MICO|nr:metallophosphoesterase [Pedococcus dokdonensis]SDP50248.1 Calcineurin-like phosphoesterase [Pedococcus dokdonensis]